MDFFFVFTKYWTMNEMRTLYFIWCSLLLLYSLWNICLVWHCQRVSINSIALFNSTGTSSIHHSLTQQISDFFLWIYHIEKYYSIYFVRIVKNSIYCFHNFIAISYHIIDWEQSQYFRWQFAATFINYISINDFLLEKKTFNLKMRNSLVRCWFEWSTLNSIRLQI